MATRPQGSDGKVMTADGEVFSGQGNVYALVVSYKGATEGDTIVLREANATGAIRVHVIIPTDNGTLSIPLGRYGRKFVAACYYSELANAAAKIRTTVIFR